MASALALQRRAPRLGFLGVGWIGRQRLASAAASGAAQIAAIADLEPAATRAAAAFAPGAQRARDLDELLRSDLDGVVIATPSALHAAQAERALEHGLAVFCQKPLACCAADARRIVGCARAKDRLLHVDLGYRHTAAARALRAVVQSGELGRIFAIEAVFENAYGPNQAWCRQRELAGGGCLLDLGVHLVDLALWMLGFPRLTSATGRLYAHGARLARGAAEVEDHASALIELDSGATLTLRCAWGAPIGRGCNVRLAFHGTKGGAALENVDGSFYDFCAERFDGARAQRIASPGDAWPGRALESFALRLAGDAHFDSEAERYADVSAALDEVYASCAC
jgi:predicted dehydrogenase